MSLPPQFEVIFNGPCYVVYGDETGGSKATLNIRIGLETIGVNRNPHTFTRVDGICSEVIIARDGAPPKTYHADSMLTVGPNAWGILQPIDGGFIGEALEMTEKGKGMHTMFVQQKPAIQGTTGSTLDLQPEPTVMIRGGSANNGVSDNSFLDVTYKGTAGQPVTTPPVATGKETGPLLTGEIVSFNLSGPESQKPTVSWWPAENVSMQPGMSLVVWGTYDAPSLVIMLEIGGPQIVRLTKILSEDK